jgi:hypothetical protein
MFLSCNAVDLFALWECTETRRHPAEGETENNQVVDLL